MDALRGVVLRSRRGTDIVVVAVAYVVAAKLGQQFATAEGGVTAVWPASGIALAALLRLGTHVLPGVALGATLGSAALGVSLGAAAAEGLAATLQAAVAGYLLRERFAFDIALARLRDVAAMAVALVLGAAVGAAVGVAGLATFGVIAWGDFAGVSSVWFVGDALGVAVVAPVLLTWRNAAASVSARRRKEVIAVFCLLAVTSHGTFAAMSGPFGTSQPFASAVTPFVIWAALRFGPSGTAAAIALVSAYAVFGTLHELGPFVRGTLAEDLLVTQMFLGVLAGTAFALVAAISERSAADRALRREAATIRLLSTVAVEANEAPSVEGAIQGTLEAVCEYAGWPIGHAYLEATDGSGDMVSARTWRFGGGSAFPGLRDALEAARFPSGTGLPGTVVATGQPGWVRDFRTDSDFACADLLLGSGVRAAFAFPILSGSRRVGVLEFFNDRPAEPDAALLEAVRQIGTQLGRVVERANAAQALRSERSFLSAVLENLEAGIVACDAAGTLTLSNRATREIHGLPTTPIPPERWPEHYDLYGPDGRQLLEHDEIPLYRALRGEHVRDAEVVVAAKNGERRRLVVSGQRITASGETLGAVVAMHDVTEQRKLEDELRHQAFHDRLTGAANRALFVDRLEHALSRRTAREVSLAVLFLDLDDFKAVNDTLGHGAGDELLVAVAQRLTASVRPSDTVARFGGDEFAVLLEDIPGEEFAVRSAERVLKAMRAPLEVGHRKVSVGVTMGIALGGPHETAEEIVRNADVAMYRAKSDRKGRWELFESGMRETLLDQLQLREDLKGALRNRQLRLQFQPIVELEKGAVVGMEALVRWKHPVRGLVPPNAFISVAEQTGLIVPIGRWVLREACREAARWREGGEARRTISVSVNLSARQLEDEDLEADVRAALQGSGLPPDSLTLELTESLLMQDPDRAVATLSRLKALGVRFAIDDFGTGYSSLDYLTRFPIDTVKIDQAFVEPLDDMGRGAPVARLIIELATALGLDVVAEGVKRPEQAAALRALGCHLGQGYLFARPLDPGAARDFVASRSVTVGVPA